LRGTPNSRYSHYLRNKKVEEACLHYPGKIRSCHGEAKMVVLSPVAGAREGPHGYAAMPTLIKLLAVVGVVAGIGYAAMFALAALVDPRPREMVVTVPPDHFVKQQH
jgi:hypothetical protein